MDQYIQAQNDQDKFLAECEAKANEAKATAEMASEEPWLQPLEDEQRAIVSARNPHASLLGLDVDGMAIFEREQDASFACHARTSNPDLAARVLTLVEMVRERDQRIKEMRDAALDAAVARDWAVE